MFNDKPTRYQVQWLFAGLLWNCKRMKVVKSTVWCYQSLCNQHHKPSIAHILYMALFRDDIYPFWRTTTNVSYIITVLENSEETFKVCIWYCGFDVCSCVRWLCVFRSISLPLVNCYIVTPYETLHYSLVFIIPYVHLWPWSFTKSQFLFLP